ncbi:dispersin export-associated protein AatB [Escherichia coli]|uniref:dispersin export-associated protein AatB n=1 Tax=Escherichia coli TaxID=562 RepID=UPI00050BAC3D|nr:dispersin export-associated protein AatB [Escherichia coli]EEW4900977.1 dispersin export-associated protein AatB [Escherichia coli]EFK4689675.1 dispersin export-associated protein AatB [Escherichia coli]EFL0619180.1 dispersin export-associated protein AatB [Escherichia coli]EHW3257242.1 dispersin export-associated protein AatB [Escherichia coli]KAE9940239.1 dispersin export-associated protein AatB [Escherichia coli]
MKQKMNFRKLDMRLNIIVYIIIFFCSTFPVKGVCDNYYGVLHGSKNVKYKSPFAGVVILEDMIEGNVVTVERKLFSVLNHEYTAKKDIVVMKRDMEEKKLARLKGVKTHSTSMFSKGLISRESLHDIDEKISNAELTIMGLDIESKNLEQLLKLSSPFLHTPFIIRNIFVTNEQYVNAGDDIMVVELLDDFYIDVKFDPVSITGNIRDKRIRYRSLVNSLMGSATVVKNIRASGESTQGEDTSGLRIITLLIDGDRNELSNLLDTAFEIIIDD